MIKENSCSIHALTQQTDDVRGHMVKRSNLREEQGMYWLANIVFYVHGQNNHHLTVFKLAVHSSQLQRMWNDAHIMRVLKGLPSIVPFEYS